MQDRENTLRKLKSHLARTTLREAGYELINYSNCQSGKEIIKKRTAANFSTVRDSVKEPVTE